MRARSTHALRQFPNAVCPWHAAYIEMPAAAAAKPRPTTTAAMEPLCAPASPSRGRCAASALRVTAMMAVDVLESISGHWRGAAPRVARRPPSARAHPCRRSRRGWPAWARRASATSAGASAAQAASTSTQIWMPLEDLSFDLRTTIRLDKVINERDMGPMLVVATLRPKPLRPQ